MASDKRNRPPKPTSTRPTPGGEAITTPQDLEEDLRDLPDDQTVTRPVDIENGDEDHADPDDGAGTEPVDLESPDDRPPRKA